MIAFIYFFFVIVARLICWYFLSLVPVDPFAQDSDVFCKPRVDAIMRLGEFIGDNIYEKDYIPLCSCHRNMEI